MNPKLRAYAVLSVMPLFLVSNMINGRPAVEIVPPWTLAALRWSIAGLVLMPFALPMAPAHLPALKSQWRRIALLGFLGMWICGGVVYVALQYTTATNGALIYTASPVIVVLFGALQARKLLPPSQMVGILLGIAGVFAIVLKGDVLSVLHQSFNLGDLLLVAAAIAWAIYSLLLKNETLQSLPTLLVFFLIVTAGALFLIPCSIVEITLIGGFPTSLRAWASIAGIVIFASLLSFYTFQYGVNTVGPAVTNIFTYLLPCYGIFLAWLFLDERVQLYHGVGLLLVLAGISLATGLPALLRNQFSQNDPMTR